MSWNYAELAQRDQIAELKRVLAVNETKLAAFQDQLFKQSEELNVTKETLNETLDKLRKEADHALELQADLGRCTNELQKEKLARENTEKTLRGARAELEYKAASVKESEHFLTQMAHSATISQAEHTKLLNEKARLEAQVKELVHQVRRLELAPPPPSTSKPAARPRSSSLTNLKLATLEHDLEQIRASASSSQTELDAVKAKLSRTHDDLLRVENEKLVLEKKMQENNRQLRDAIEERRDLERELEFLRGQNGSEERENDLLSRLEEEEQKVALLEAELTKLSQSKGMKRKLENVTLQLDQEIAKRQAVEQRESYLVQEKEEALNDLFEIKGNMQELRETLALREQRIQDLEKLESKLFENLEAGVSQPSSHSTNASTVAPEIEKSVETMLSAISRLRLERDQLRMDFDYVQMETRFRIEAFESEVTRLQAQGQQGAEDATRQHFELEQLRFMMRDEKKQRRNLQIAMSVMTLVTQRLQQENDEVHDELNSLINSHNEASSYAQETISALQLLVNSKEEEISSSSLIIMNLRAELGSKTEQLSEVSEASRLAFESKEEEVSQLQHHLSTNAKTIEDGAAERTALERRVRELESELASMKDEFEDMRQSSNRLMAMQTSGLSSDATTHALRAEIETLQGRVLRRQEQIGIHQHEIKRLETNLRLLEDRMEEFTADLEMASTEKEAMLEDCTNSRSERDETKKALESAEIEIDKLSASLAQMDEQMQALQRCMSSSINEREQSDLTHVEELATLVELIADRDCHIKTLSSSLKAANVNVQGARKRISSLAAELEAARSSVTQTIEDVHAQKQGALKAYADDLDNKTAEVQRLSTELEVARIKEEELVQSIQSQQDKLEGAKERIEELETGKNELLVKLENFEMETNHLLEESSSLRLALEEERSTHVSAVKTLEDKLCAIQATNQTELDNSKQTNDDLHAQLKQMSDSLQIIEAELEESKALCERLESDRDSVSSDRTQAVTEMQGQIDQLTQEVERLQCALQKEIDDRKDDRETHILELKAEISKHESSATTESELRKEVENYKAQLTDLQSIIDELTGAKEDVQAELDNISADCHRANLQCQCLEKQVASNEKEIAALGNEINTIRQSLSQTEKDCRAAEMKLVLNNQQHDQTISSLRSQMKAYEKDSDMVAELREMISRLKEQIGEMDDLLRAKCIEIEENDDKFIELLKEKKKLTSKVESLTRKNQSLRKKLEASEAASKAESIPQEERPSPSAISNFEAPATTPPQMEPPSSSLAFTKPSYSTLPTPVRSKTPEGSRLVSTPIASTGREGTLVTPTNQKMTLTTTSTIGKKRPLPEDSYPTNVPVAAIICEEPYHANGNMSTPPMPSSSSMPSMPSTSSGSSMKPEPTTPRSRRPLQTLRSGFTPNRGQGNALRPTLSQPSPIRKTASQALHIASAITEMPSGPAAKRIFSAAPQHSSQKPPSRGWLGKIRGGNPLLRTRQQPSTEDLI